MDAKELAAKLTGLEYRNEITKRLEAEAKAAGLVIVFGARDDIMVFRGAIRDEIDANMGTTATVDQQGIVPVFDNVDRDSYDALKDFFKREGGTVKIEALWCAEADYSWTFRTSIPHETFEIVEAGEPYCRGIVFALADVKSK